jgi:hypothetical protein
VIMLAAGVAMKHAEALVNDTVDNISISGYR